MRRKGFTLIELLVVIAIIAMLMSILMPALARVREMAQRVVCGTNQSGLGKAMAVYAGNDDSGRFPCAGGRSSVWGPVAAWDDPDKIAAFDLDPGPGAASISSSLYLLVKGDYTTAKQFVCKSDPDTDGAFGYGDPYAVWDFGAGPSPFCSYAYHMTYDDGTGFRFRLSAASNPGLAVTADRNPYLLGTVLTADPEQNSFAHQEDGQNVLYVDGHVSWEKRADCGLNEDNIYTWADNEDTPQIGTPPVLHSSAPYNKRDDSLLVNE